MVHVSAEDVEMTQCMRESYFKNGTLRQQYEDDLDSGYFAPEESFDSFLKRCLEEDGLDSADEEEVEAYREDYAFVKFSEYVRMILQQKAKIETE